MQIKVYILEKMFILEMTLQINRIAVLCVVLIGAIGMDSLVIATNARCCNLFKLHVRLLLTLPLMSVSLQVGEYVCATTVHGRY